MRDLARLPKAHLHVHLEGAMRPSTLAELASVYGIEVPSVRGFGSFPEFAGMYLAACDVLRSPADMRRLVDEVVEDAATDGAVWLEPGFYAAHHLDRLGPAEEVIELVLDALAESARRHHVAAGLMVVGDRTRHPDDALQQARLAVRYADRGVVAFGLANDEVAGPPEPFAEAFALAKGAGLLSTPHAGELVGPDSVRAAIDALGADRLQHGVRAVEDPALVDRLAEAEICCDVCPTSNVMLSVAPSVEASSLGRLLDAGVPCSVNADDPLLFGPGLLDEYQACRDRLRFDDGRLAHIARCSLRASGAPKEVKRAGLAGVDAWMAEPA